MRTSARQFRWLSRARASALLVSLAIALPGCVSPKRCCCQPHRNVVASPATPVAGPTWTYDAPAICAPMASAIPVPPIAYLSPIVTYPMSQTSPTLRHPHAPPHGLFYGSDGRIATLHDVLLDASGADLVAFGELHGHDVGAAYQYDLLDALYRTGRPLALAMEFFERDTQAVLDQYLRGEIDVLELKKRARQGAAYDRTHGPLIDYCKQRGIPVIAANAPRRLVTGYRKSGLSYNEYLASLSDEDRGWLPRSTTTPNDAYRDRFVSFMGEERGAAIFKSQALWDDAMAEAVTDFKNEHPNHRVLLIVGGFHVTGGLGTLTKYKQRRTSDSILTVLMDHASDKAKPPAWNPDAKDTAEYLLMVHPQPRPKPKGTPKADKPAH